MPTLVEELKRAEENQQKQNELRKCIINFVTRPDVCDTLKKAASKGVNAQLNNGYIQLKAKDYVPQLKPLGYLFLIDAPNRAKPLLLAHIELIDTGVCVYIEQYDSGQLTKEHALQSLQTIIGLEDE